MPTSLSLLVMLLVIALAIAGASLTSVILVGLVACAWEVYATGSSNGVR